MLTLISKVRLIAISSLALVLCATSHSGAYAFYEPERGSPHRKALMDGLRSIAERAYGAPVEFVVHEIRLGRGVAFVRVEGQRPGGGSINLRTTPLHQYEGVPLDLISSASTEALMINVAGRWKVIHFANAPTDVWWANSEYCPVFAEVLPEICR
jgi:hypothetical protein